jgi:hypothetical protein
VSRALFSFEFFTIIFYFYWTSFYSSSVDVCYVSWIHLIKCSTSPPSFLSNGWTVEREREKHWREFNLKASFNRHVFILSLRLVRCLHYNIKCWREEKKIETWTREFSFRAWKASTFWLCKLYLSSRLLFLFYIFISFDILESLCEYFLSKRFHRSSCRES